MSIMANQLAWILFQLERLETGFRNRRLQLLKTAGVQPDLSSPLESNDSHNVTLNSSFDSTSVGPTRFSCKYNYAHIYCVLMIYMRTHMCMYYTVCTCVLLYDVHVDILSDVHVHKHVHESVHM